MRKAGASWRWLSVTRPKRAAAFKLGAPGPPFGQRHPATLDGRSEQSHRRPRQNQPAAQTVGAPAQHWELARKCVADITWGKFTYEPERFKHFWFSELPMMGSHAEASSVALWRTYSQFLAANEAFKGVTLLGVGMLGGGQFHHPSKVIDTPDDLKGQKVRMGGPIQKRLLEDPGAIPVSGPGQSGLPLHAQIRLSWSDHASRGHRRFRAQGQFAESTGGGHLPGVGALHRRRCAGLGTAGRVAFDQPGTGAVDEVVGKAALQNKRAACFLSTSREPF